MGRPKGSKNVKGKGAPSMNDLIKALGPKGMEVVKTIHSRYKRETLLVAVRTYPKLPSQTEALLAKLSDAKAKEMREQLLKVV